MNFDEALQTTLENGGSQEFITLRGIAVLMGCEIDIAFDIIERDENFPEALDFGDGYVRRWKRDEVLAYFAKVLDESPGEANGGES